jgi:hypothetical protein
MTRRRSKVTKENEPQASLTLSPPFSSVAPTFPPPQPFPFNGSSSSSRPLPSLAPPHPHSRTVTPPLLPFLSLSPLTSPIMSPSPELCETNDSSNSKSGPKTSANTASKRIPLPILISTAIAQSSMKRLTLGEICSWIVKYHPHFKDTASNWRVSGCF